MRYRILFLALLLPALAVGEEAWVSDEFEITLRTGPSTSNAIQMMLSSGTELEVLERDREAGYTRVRTQGGTEGWVLSRYLMDEPAAREQLARLTEQLTNAATEGSSLESSLNSVRREMADARNRISQLEQEKRSLEEELAEITRISSNALALDKQNTELRETLAETEIQVATLEQETRALASQTNRYWFITGGGVIVVGILLGLWLPRIRMPRRSRYDRL